MEWRERERERGRERERERERVREKKRFHSLTLCVQIIAMTTGKKGKNFKGNISVMPALLHANAAIKPKRLTSVR